MKNLLFIICLLPIGLIGQVTDSIVYHFPNKINCTGVDFIIDGNVVGTQTLTPGVTNLDYSKFGVSYSSSAKYTDYTLIIRDRNTDIMTPNEILYIKTTGCMDIPNTYQEIYSGKIE